jgi:hypothetical protein
MNLPNATNRLSVFIIVATAWPLFHADFAVAQSKQGRFVIHDPVVAGTRESALSLGTPSGTVPARTRKFLPSSWDPVQGQVKSPEQKLDQNAGSIDFKDSFQDQLQGEIKEAAELDQEKLAVDRRMKFDFGNWPRKTISEIRPSVKDTNKVVPQDYSYLLTEKVGPDWFMAPSGEKVFAWTAPNIHYQPLYFQNVALERYGQTYGGLKQIGASGLHFFTSFCRLPYAVIVDHPRSCEYPLGYCRPGNPTPMTFQKLLYPCRD